MKAGYQPEIDGLRTLAVAGVLLCHVKIPGFSGGFAGVDVFFVISGYLITGMILRDIASGSFSFRDFYVRRTRRIFPALIATLGVSLLVASVFFSPEALKAFAASLIGAILSVSNILFWTQQGYFDTASNLKPLLHTWSLGVEEQFYLLWPLTLFLLSRWRIAPAPALVVLFAASLTANYAFADHTSSIFFLLPFRIFEFAIGALALWFEPHHPKSNIWHEIGVGTGLTMIVASYLVFDETSHFPSFPALLPCFGAAAIILSRRARYCGSLLRHPLALYLGRRSYSLYLVHWPIIVFYGYVTAAPFSWKTGIWLALAAIPIADALYTFVEQRFRLGGTKPVVLPYGFFPCFAVLVALLVLVGATAIPNGWLWRLGDRSIAYQQLIGPDGLPKDAAAYGGEGCGNQCETNPGKPVSIYVVGDSTAQQYLTGFKAAFPSINVRIFQFSSCPFFSPEFTRDFTDSSDPKLYDDGCRAARRAAFEQIKGSNAIVIISQVWRSFPLVSEKTGERIPAGSDSDSANFAGGQLRALKTDLGINQLLVIGTTPGTSGNSAPLDCMSRPVSINANCAESPSNKSPQLERSQYNNQLEAALQGEAVFLDPFGLLCSGKTCRTVDRVTPLYSDPIHLTRRGSELLIGEFSPSIGQALANRDGRQ
jgi:peptidoglycan/LPS O-acetylase OafA/YrhL